MADFTVLRAKAKANLLGAYRSGELEQAPERFEVSDLNLHLRVGEK